MEKKVGPSTTNVITTVTVVATAVMVILSMLEVISDIPPVAAGFWGAIISFTIGAKTGKSVSASTEVKETFQDWYEGSEEIDELLSEE